LNINVLAPYPSGEGRGEVNFYREDGGEVNEFHEGLGEVK
jgi:hypothetical protein